MGTIASSVILNEAARKLYDETNIHWGADELLADLNAGIAATCEAKPDAFTETGDITLVAGTIQSTPARSTQFLRPISNAAGQAVTVKDRNSIDNSNRSWHADTPSANVLHVFYDDRDPKRFLVWPPATVGTTIKASWSATPERITEPADTFPLDDIYENALRSWVIGSAMMKTTKRSDMNKGQAWLAMWANEIGGRAQVQSMFAPLPPEDTSDSRTAEEA